MSHPFQSNPQNFKRSEFYSKVTWNDALLLFSNLSTGKFFWKSDAVSTIISNSFHLINLWVIVVEISFCFINSIFFYLRKFIRSHLSHNIVKYFGYQPWLLIWTPTILIWMVEIYLLCTYFTQTNTQIWNILICRYLYTYAIHIMYIKFALIVK